MALSCPLGITRCVPQVNNILFSYTKSFVFQGCFYHDGWRLALFFFSFFFAGCGPQLRLGAETRKKKRTWPIFSHVDLTPGQ